MGIQYKQTKSTSHSVVGKISYIYISYNNSDISLIYIFYLYFYFYHLESSFKSRSFLYITILWPKVIQRFFKNVDLVSLSSIPMISIFWQWVTLMSKSYTYIHTWICNVPHRGLCRKNLKNKTVKPAWKYTLLEISISPSAFGLVWNDNP